MAAEDIKRHQFTSENQPGKRRSRKGVPNRSTLLKKWLNSKVTLPRHLVPNGLKGPQRGTIEDHIALALIARALRGNVPAIREVLDTVYGKVTQTNVNVTPEQLREMSDADLDALLKAMGYQPLESISEFKARAAARQREVELLMMDDDGP